MAMIDGATSQLVRDAKAGLTCESENADQLAANILKMSKMNTHEIYDSYFRNFY